MNFKLKYPRLIVNITVVNKNKDVGFYTTKIKKEEFESLKKNPFRDYGKFKGEEIEYVHFDVWDTYEAMGEDGREYSIDYAGDPEEEEFWTQDADKDAIMEVVYGSPLDDPEHILL